MQRTLLADLICPKCGSALRLDSVGAGDEVETGSLACVKCLARYEIRDGIPSLLDGPPAGNDEGWERLHQKTAYERMAEAVVRRFALPEQVVLDYYVHARLARQQGANCERVLELGAGTGAYSLALQCYLPVKQLVLADVSRAALAGARVIFRRMQVPAQFVQADIRRLPFRDRTFTLSLSGGLIEHFAGEEQRAILREHCRVAGQVLLAAPANLPAYWLFRWAYSLRRGGWPFGYERPLSRRSLSTLLREQGFDRQQFAGQDYAAAMELFGRLRWPGFPRLHAWPGLAWLTRHDWVVWAVPGKEAADGGQ
jgi:SAM-dependent methyltransferase